MKILVLGESCQDIFHYGECKRLCPAAPVPVFNSIHMIKNGGMAKNVEKNLRQLTRLNLTIKMGRIGIIH